MKISIICPTLRSSIGLFFGICLFIKFTKFLEEIESQSTLVFILFITYSILGAVLRKQISLQLIRGHLISVH